MKVRDISSPCIVRVIFLALAASLLVFGIALAQSALPALDQWVIGASGGGAETGTFRLEGTLGQPITGLSIGGAVALSAGFWTGPASTYPLFLPLVVH